MKPLNDQTTKSQAKKNRAATPGFSNALNNTL